MTQGGAGASRRRPAAPRPRRGLLRSARPAALLLALGVAAWPVRAQTSDLTTGAVRPIRASQLVLPATLGSAAGTVLGFLGGQSLGWGGGDDPGLTGAIVGAGVGSVAGTSIGLLLARSGAIPVSVAIPAATLGVAAGLGTVLLLGAVADIDPGGFLLGYSVGQGFFAGIMAAALQARPAPERGERQ